MTGRIDSTPLGQTDAGSDRETHLKPCSKRVDWGTATSWCLLPEKHEGDCYGSQPRELRANDFGPRGKR